MTFVEFAALCADVCVQGGAPPVVVGRPGDPVGLDRDAFESGNAAQFGMAG